ncbi:MAG: hypothetical protein MUC43_11790 [Pirellula sp.]|jgi:hypothetical protein|nr:hypothetical protein [Pirellula sp.]
MKTIHILKAIQVISYTTLLPCIFLCCVGVQSAAMGQLIGNRTIGAAIGSSQPRAQAGNPNSGSLSPSINGRFVRGNRSRNEFVGSSRTDQQGFVGSTQAIGVGRVQSSVEGLRVPNQRSVNRPLPAQPSTGLYYPKLDLDFGTAQETSDRLGETTRAETVFSEAQERISKIAGAKINVVRVGGLAIVRGTVQSKKTEDLIVTLLGFEPGVDQIKNELHTIEE